MLFGSATGVATVDGVGAGAVVEVVVSRFAEVVKNLELSKTLLNQETPVIQVVDQSTFPLEKEKPVKLVVRKATTNTLQDQKLTLVKVSNKAPYGVFFIS